MTQHASPGVEALKVLVIDDHHLVRLGLHSALRQVDPDCKLLEAETLAAGISAIEENSDIDLVLLDLGLPGCRGIDAVELLYASCPSARVVVVSATYDLRTVQLALKRGVLGFVPKLSGAEVLVSALQFVLAGGIYVPPETLFNGGEVPALGASSPPGANSPQAAGLTARQIDVLKLLLDGRSNKQICRDLNLALGTVKSHVAAILQTLGCSTRAQAVAAVEKRGWRHALMGDAADAGREPAKAAQQH
ncbi:response regulator [Caenimonas aquaedulcis]|uniref:Response regulator transcription factor n=1 Tax=Caenimonas aquaedulcis TaxID=2793270 RepID=A0A931H4T0_9BURK|nr:response regulator transcription factor [Caenimonas aquaedulcis]MBG9388644.1 response regulator transcription factor [Caenimonas aquaedulcis]